MSAWRGQTGAAMDVLFLSESSLGPLDQGFRVHGVNMAMALARRGLRVAMASLCPTQVETLPEAARGLLHPWPAASPCDLSQAGALGCGVLGWPRRRLLRYLAPGLSKLAGALRLVRELSPRVVIGLGPHGAILLKLLQRSFEQRQASASRTVSETPTLIWYAADELCFFHASCLLRETPSLWPARLKKLAVSAGLEQLFARGLPRGIGVSPTDSHLLHHLAGICRVHTIRNGVDTAYFTPQSACPHTLSNVVVRGCESPAGPTLAFWGRMDFEPNVDAMTWFVQHVWPGLRQNHPKAVLTIAGKAPTPAVQRLAEVPGVQVVGEVADIRPLAWRAAVTILPMRCGGGIKNKLLEAAAMGCAIVASPLAVKGLVLDDASAMRVCRSPASWQHAIEELWSQPDKTQRMGQAARAWVLRHHTWDQAAAALASACNLPPQQFARLIHGHARTALAIPPTGREPHREAA